MRSNNLILSLEDGIDLCHSASEMDACAFCSYGIGSVECNECHCQRRYEDLSDEVKHDLGQTSYCSRNYGKRKED